MDQFMHATYLWIILLGCPAVTRSNIAELKIAEFDGTLEGGQCESLSLPMCRALQLYNRTRLPNFFNHQTQAESGLEMNQFWSLVKIECSPVLGFFLCSIYAPICMKDFSRSLLPCRSVCEASRDGCAPIMRRYGFEWPKQLNCEAFPVNKGDDMCMEPPKSMMRLAPKIDAASLDISGISLDLVPKNEGSSPVDFNMRPPLNGLHVVSSGDDRPNKCRCSCRPPFKTVPSEYNPNRPLLIGNVSGCASPCRSVYFTATEQQFSVFWIGLWSVACCVSTLITLLTFLIDMDRFQYPERSIVFLSLCYFLVSLGYITRWITGHEYIACDSNYGTVRGGRTDSGTCTGVFLVIYIFGMASCIWWVVLTLTWFLAAGLKWSSEAISKYSHYFHILAWCIPSIKAIAIVALSAVDGDPVSGICYVGNTNRLMLRIFVLGPLLFYLLLGSFFLFAGFVSLFRIRHIVVKQHGHDINTDKLEILIVRIGMFSVLYTVPATIVLACYFYEQHYRHVWEMSLTCDANCLSQGYKPAYIVFMLKYVMLLVVGVTAGMWIWTHKTAESWIRFYRRICIGCCCRRRSGEHHQHVYQPAEAIIGVRSSTDVSTLYTRYVVDQV